MRRLSLILLLAACDRAPALLPDARPLDDRGLASADASTRGDASVAPDAAEPGPDAQVVDSGATPASLIGTRFEGVRGAWVAPLELCANPSARDIADARAARIHVTLPVADRRDLSLVAARLDGVIARRSPFAADQRALGTSSTTLDAWDLTDPRGDARLSARLTHRFAGGGEVVEEISALRDGSDTRAVDYDALAEVSFTYVEAGNPIALERCGYGDANRVDALDVLVADGPAGATLAILREARKAEVFAGRAPITPIRGQVSVSTSPWIPWAARGPWAWTYAASLHNWNEYSTLDFAADPGLWHTIFRPGLADPVAPDFDPIQKIDLLGVNGPGVSGTLEVTTRGRASGQLAVTTWQARTTWQRVDAASVQPSCGAAGRVETLALGPNAILQLGICADAIDVIVPVLFPYDHSRDGERVSGADLTATDIDGKRGVRVAIGAHTALAIARFDAQYWIVRFFDEAGMDAYTTLAEPLRNAPWDPADEVFDRHAAGGVAMKMLRRYVWQGTGESAIYAPISFALTFGGQTHVVDAFDRLDYTNSHHNWLDRLVARTDDLELHWRIDYENGPLVERVSARRLSDGMEVLPETIVER